MMARGQALLISLTLKGTQDRVVGLRQREWVVRSESWVKT